MFATSFYRKFNMTLSKHLTNVVQNLEKKKFREKYNLFKIEGEKLVNEALLSNFQVHTIIAKEKWLKEHEKKINNFQLVEVSEREMEKLSNFKSPPEVIALIKIPEQKWQEEHIRHSLSVILNGVQDPGNLGTILRVCDWFGIHSIFCDTDCAHAFNPKSIQASMGAIFRVHVFYLDLLEFIPQFVNSDFHCYGTFLDGDNIYQTSLQNTGFIVMGNEGKGISPEIEPFISQKLTIPRFAESSYSTESLNVGVATGIILSEFKRK